MWYESYIFLKKTYFYPYMNTFGFISVRVIEISEILNSIVVVEY
jgi:hypothetical protein